MDHNIHSAPTSISPAQKGSDGGVIIVNIYRRRIWLLLLVLFAGAGSFLVLRHLQASIYGVPPGYTGGPWDAVTCATAGCHRGPVTTVSGWVSTDVPTSGYIPGDTYNITLTASRPQTNLFGFQVTAQNGEGVQGRFLITDPVQTQFSLNDGYVTHKLAGTQGANQKTWAMKWIAPDPASQEGIVFYAAFVAGVFDIDDEVFLSTRPVKLHVSVAEPEQVKGMPLVYPNPFYGRLTVRGHDPDDLPRTLSLHDLTGVRVYHDPTPLESGFLTWILRPEDLPEGIYLLEVVTNNNRYCQKVICRRP